MVKGAIPFPGFVGPTYKTRFGVADAERCVNLFPEIVEVPNGKNQLSLVPTPGATTFATSSNSHGRGIFHQDGRGFTVIGGIFYEFTSAGILVDYGPVDVNNHPVTISSSGEIGQELLVTSGGSAYLFDLVANTFTRIADIDSAIAGAYLDGFFLVLTENSELKISAYADGTTWDPTQFRVRAIGSDKWVAMVVIHREIWLLGTKSYEVWYNAGAHPFPFLPIQGAYHTEGIAARASIAEFGTGVIWLAKGDKGGGVVMQATQYAPARVSNHAVEAAIQDYVRAGATIDDAIGTVHEMDGHEHYVLTFPDADATWTLDRSTGMWHERMYWDANNTRERAWRFTHHAFAFDKHLFCDLHGGNIYAVGMQHHSDVADAEIRRVRRFPHVAAAGRRIRYHQLGIDMAVGRGLESGQGSNPLVMMRMSNNGAVTWGNEHTRSSGAIGKWKTRVEFNKLGQSDRRVFEIAMSDPVPWHIINAYLRVS
jgi:hypothetical protein